MPLTGIEAQQRYESARTFGRCVHSRSVSMNKLIALALSATALVALPTPAEARHHHHYRNYSYSYGGYYPGYGYPRSVVSVAIGSPYGYGGYGGYGSYGGYGGYGGYGYSP